LGFRTAAIRVTEALLAAGIVAWLATRELAQLLFELLLRALLPEPLREVLEILLAERLALAAFCELSLEVLGELPAFLVRELLQGAVERFGELSLGFRIGRALCVAEGSLAVVVEVVAETARELLQRLELRFGTLERLLLPLEGFGERFRPLVARRLRRLAQRALGGFAILLLGERREPLHLLIEGREIAFAQRARRLRGELVLL
jgi:hypothetical protein